MRTHTGDPVSSVTPTRPDAAIALLDAVQMTMDAVEISDTVPQNKQDESGHRRCTSLFCAMFIMEDNGENWSE